jgi:hypothetical protein
MPKLPDDMEVVDTSGLTDADWAEITKVREAYRSGGKKALDAALEELQQKDLYRLFRVIGAFWPDALRESIRDKMAEMGMTKEDLQELIRTLDPPPTKQ